MLRRCNFEGCNFASTSEQMLESHQVHQHCKIVRVSIENLVSNYVNECNDSADDKIMYKCSHMDCEFYTKNGFDMIHHRYHKHNEIVSPCHFDECKGKMFIDNTEHYKEVHVFDLTCKFCKLLQPSLTALKNHIKTIHAAKVGLDESDTIIKPEPSIDLEHEMNMLWLDNDKHYLVNDGYISLHCNNGSQNLGGFTDMRCRINYRSYMSHENDDQNLHIAYGNYLKEMIDKLRSKEKVAPRKDNVSEKQELKDNIYFREDPRLPFLQLTGNAITWLNLVQGHVIPAADFVYDMTLVHDTYKVSNLIPMYERCNNGIMKQAENLIRNIAEKSQKLRVFTLALYDEYSIVLKSAGGILIKIPSHFAKLAYIWKENRPVQALVLIFPHKRDEFLLIYDYISTIEELERLSGLKFMHVPLVGDQND